MLEQLDKEISFDKVCYTHDDYHGSVEPGNVILARYRLQKPIGQGSYGKVYAATDLCDNTKVAIKVFGGSNRPLRSQKAVAHQESLNFKMTRDSVSQCMHVIDEYEDSKHYYMVLELFRSSLQRRTMQLSEESKQYVATEILKCVNSLASLGYSHNDIKPDNVLINFKFSWTWKVAVTKVALADFGLLQRIGTGAIVTQFYEAPEISITGLCYKNSDIWSLAVLLAELHFRCSRLFPEKDRYDRVVAMYLSTKQTIPPYLIDQSPQSHVWKSIFSKGHPTIECSRDDEFSDLSYRYSNKLQDHLFKAVDTPVKDYLSKALIIDPQIRLSAQESLAHEYFNQH